MSFEYLKNINMSILKYKIESFIAFIKSPRIECDNIFASHEQKNNGYETKGNFAADGSFLPLQLLRQLVRQVCGEDLFLSGQSL